MIRIFSSLLLLGALWFHAAALGAVPGSLSPEATLSLLYGRGDQTVTDPEGFTYRMFPVHRASELQNLIDAVTERLLQTTIGTSICRDLLNENPDLISTHLGVSERSAKAAAKACGRVGAMNIKSEIVYNARDQVPFRLTGLGANPARQYMIVVTDHPDLPVDSWTETYTNVTTLFLHHSTARSDLNLRFLMQTIAHEMAIYFDAKAWPWGPDWHRVPALDHVKIRNENSSFAAMAALNPAIGTVLSFIRAYKVERQMLRELFAEGRLGPEPIFYSQSELPFLRLNCTAECLEKFILEQGDWLKALYLPLLAYSPHYRIRRMQFERIRAFNASGPVDEQLLNVLEMFPVKYIQNVRGGGMFFEKLFRKPTANDTAEAETTAAVMHASLVPSDLGILSRAMIVSPFLSANMDLLTYLSIPLLSDANSGISSGPRPRIRTGGTR